MKRILLLFFLIETLGSIAQIVEHEWTRIFPTGSASPFSTVNGMSFTEQGYVYTASSFRGSFWIGPGPYGTDIYSSGDEDILINKISATNNDMWYRQIGGTGFDLPSHIEQFSNGDLLIAGVFSDSVDFDPGQDTVLKVSQGETDNFLLRLDKDGNYINCTTFGGSGSAYICDLILTENDEIVMCGWYKDSMNLSPTPFDHLYVSDAGMNSFISKFDADFNFIEAASFDGDVLMLDLFETPEGRFLFMGDFRDTLSTDFVNGSEVLYSAGMRDVFHGEFDEDLNLIALTSIESESDEMGMGIAQLEDGKVVLQINFADFIDLGNENEEFLVEELYPDITIYQPTVFRNALIVCFEGENVAWFKRFSGFEPIARIFSDSKLTLDNQGNLLLSYYYQWRCDLGEENYGLMGTQGWKGAFLMSLTPSGDIRWIRSFDGDSQKTVYVRSMKIHKDNLFVGGQMSGNLVDFDLSVGQSYEYGWKKPFLVKYTLHDQFLGMSTLENNHPTLFPNPSDTRINLMETNIQNIQIFDLSGRSIDADYSFDGETYQINTSSLQNGVYNLMYTHENEQFNQKFVVQH